MGTQKWLCSIDTLLEMIFIIEDFNYSNSGLGSPCITHIPVRVHLKSVMKPCTRWPALAQGWTRMYTVTEPSRNVPLLVFYFSSLWKIPISLGSIISLQIFSTKKKKKVKSFTADRAEGSAINLNFHMKMAEGLWESLVPAFIQF